MNEPLEYKTLSDLEAIGYQDCSIWYNYTPKQPGRVSGPPKDCENPRADRDYGRQLSEEY